MTGRLLYERLAPLALWVLFAGYNLTYSPQHFFVVIRMLRSHYTYAAGTGWGFWNFWSTVGAFGIAFGFFLFAVNSLLSLRSWPPALSDPWDGLTREGRTSSPPPPHDFE